MFEKLGRITAALPAGKQLHTARTYLDYASILTFVLNSADVVYNLATKYHLDETYVRHLKTGNPVIDNGLSVLGAYGAARLLYMYITRDFCKTNAEKK